MFEESHTIWIYLIGTFISIAMILFAVMIIKFSSSIITSSPSRFKLSKEFFQGMVASVIGGIIVLIGSFFMFDRPNYGFEAFIYGALVFFVFSLFICLFLIIFIWGFEK